MSEWRDPSTIGDEVQKQLERLRAAGDTTQAPTVVTELPNDGTESIRFEPENEAFGANHVVEIGDYKINIHETANFQIKFGVFIKPEVKTKSMLSLHEHNEQVYGPDLEETHFEELARELQDIYPKLYAKLVEIATKNYQKRDALHKAVEEHGYDSDEYEEAKADSQRSLEQSNLESYYFSKVYDALAKITVDSGMAVDLKILCT